MPPPRDVPNFIEGPGDWTITSVMHSDTYPAVSPSQFNLSGKVVFVTGASKGIGRATAISFARAGATVIPAARSPNDLPNSIQLDVTDNAAVEAAIAKLDRLDIVINCAGIAGPIPLIADSIPKAWSDVWDTNVKGVYHVTRATLPLVRKTKGMYINVSSVAAHLVHPGASAYGPGKLALLRFTEYLAAEEPDIIAVAIHPGNILNEITKDLPKEMEYAFTDTNALPADTMVWMCAERREWMDGRYISVNWDMPELEAKKDAIVQGNKLKVVLSVDV